MSVPPDTDTDTPPPVVNISGATFADNTSATRHRLHVQQVATGVQSISTTLGRVKGRKAPIGKALRIAGRVTVEHHDHGARPGGRRMLKEGVTAFPSGLPTASPILLLHDPSMLAYSINGPAASLLQMDWVCQQYVAIW
eukprot:scaffold55008_cov18-Tisochrysis_lutea.AAC.1